MAKIDEIEKRLEERIRHVIVGVWTVAIVIIGWLGAGTFFLISMHGDIQAIKQYEKDHGGEIVRAIERPKNIDQLAANLALAAAQLQVARSEHRKPDESKLTTLQTAVAKAVDSNPDLPEVWQAAVQLVDYKYQGSSTINPEQPNCLDTLHADTAEVDRVDIGGFSADYPNFSGPQAPNWVSHVFLGHCSLNLDDDGTFSSSALGKFFSKVKRLHPQASQFILVMNDAYITYSGGKIIPVSEIQFDRCTFELRQPAILPSKTTQAMTTQLLASNVTNGNLQIPKAD